MKNVFVGVAHYKILLAILGVVSSIASFQVWKWNQEQHEKFLAEQQKACQQDLDIAEDYVNNSKTLYSVYNADVLHQGKFNKEIERPGNNSPFEPGASYILIYNTPAALIPSHPRYDGKFFESLSKKTLKYSPQPLMVVAKSFQPNQATVTTSCSPKPFTVSLDNLYEISQKSDFDFTPSFSMF
ncbi:hypothetical protein H6G97_20920 [Nostoc flagelliforme FACHB-838]|uniref:Uncharacterized protein n=1 Tax=Nostoc flagelliforme FACHB-838 TaxID=2692904 RepID=A0ABR8DU72_9NOSO|nr:hypothetical protein [Nostoc flagelliforme]MBD2531913.1 hypothetical protein [Nostoc flagelliforme FACHB-838]